MPGALFIRQKRIHQYIGMVDDVGLDMPVLYGE